MGLAGHDEKGGLQSISLRIVGEGVSGKVARAISEFVVSEGFEIRPAVVPTEDSLPHDGIGVLQATVAEAQPELLLGCR